MAVVILPYAYSDGAVLDPAAHNSNIFSATGDQGLASEPNGGLDPTNLAPGFAVQPEHVWPGEAVRMAMESRLDSVDYMDDALADSASGDADDAYATVAGAAVRFFLPWQAGAVLWQWTAFLHCFRFRDGAGAASATPAIRFRAFVDGSPVAHTRRLLPETAFDDNAGGANDHLLIGRETRNARSWDMAHLDRNLAAGWHELAVRAYMDVVDHQEVIRRTVGDQSGNWQHRVHHRLTAGICNARALVLL